MKTLKRLNTNSEVINVNDFDNVTVSNLNLVTEKKVKTKKTTVKNAIAEKLSSLDYSIANKLTKSIKSIDFLFSSIRSIILSLIANNVSMNVFDKAEIVSILRKSKKDVELYVLLRRLSAFTYKAIKTKSDDVTTTNIIKSFSVKSVLNACIVYSQISSVELTESLVQSIQHEHENNAYLALEKNVESLQTKCSTLQNLIDKLKDTANAEKLELSEQLVNTEIQLTEKIKMLEYLKIQSNRRLIK